MTMTAAGYENLIQNRDKGLRAASLVRLRPEYGTRIRKLAPGTVLVVIADKFEKVNCAPLGGTERGEYWRIPATWVRVIDPASVTVSG